MYLANERNNEEFKCGSFPDPRPMTQCEGQVGGGGVVVQGKSNVILI